MLLWASGAEFGFRRTLPHVIGTAVGIGAMALAVVAGIGALVTMVPELEFAMKVAGSLYLIYLAYQIAGAGALRPGSIARPMGLLQAAAFQAINPKAWSFALSAVTTFRPAELSGFVGGAAPWPDDDARGRSHGGAVGCRRRPHQSVAGRRASPPDREPGPRRPARRHGRVRLDLADR